MNANTAVISGKDSKRDLHAGRVKVVARYVNGKVLKGYTHDFSPNKQIFRLAPDIDEPSGEAANICIPDLKALFFVRDFAGNSSYDEEKHFSQDNHFHGHKIEVTFRDNEVLIGTTVGYTPQRLGFFLFPADPKGNNLRVFVISSAVKKVRFL